MKLDLAYDPSAFENFLTEFLPSFHKDSRGVINNSGLFSKVLVLGSAQELDLTVFEITLDTSVDRRIAITTEAFRLMKQHQVYRALIVFKPINGDTWRLSLMTSQPTIDNGKVITKLSNPRRYSYLLGVQAKIVTPSKYLIKLGKVTDFEDLKNRFSVEVVNNEFYREIAKLYDQLVGTNEVSAQLKYPEQGEAAHQFAVRLIGRIVFCWFLREKLSNNGRPLISRDVLSAEAATRPSYYHDTLALLFFEVLNKPGEKRIQQFQENAFGDIPYLNGGLFSPQYEDNYRFNPVTGQSVPGTVDVPNEWLVKFFDLLETYHFTVDENTSVDIDLSIDPEMLGRIFENLLARINPETGETVRKSTGSFYTPREIVEYMVDESLIQYLAAKTAIDNDKLRALISYDLEDDKAFPLDLTEKQIIVKALSDVKVLDPACGSGAFPIGMLQKVVFTLQQIDPEAKLWFEDQIASTPPEVRHLIEREFKHKNFDYIRKLGVIRESIFGVDIQPIATEIARLRCFLTLIVDERVTDDEKNRGVYPLPNLDFKFVTANTLLKLNIPKVGGKEQAGLFEDQRGIDELKQLRDEYFNSHNSERDSLKLQFSQAQNRMLQNIIQNNRHGLSDTTQKLSTWDPFSNKSASWFDPEWVFGIGDGFDIVIANPPYIDSESMTKQDPEGRSALTANYSTAKGNWDIFVVFVELGIDLLSKNGALSYIIPNKLIAAKYTETLRRYMQQKTITSIRDYSRFNVFKEADIYPIVFTCTNRSDDSSPISFETMSPYEITKQLTTNTISRLVFNKDIYWDKYFLSPNVLELLLKIDANPRLETFCPKIKGAATVSEAYEIKDYLMNYSELKDKATPHKRLVNTGTIDPYVTTWETSPTQYIKGRYTQPVILDSEIFKINPTRLKQSSSEKLIIAGMSKSPECVYDIGNMIAGKSTSIILVEEIRDAHPLLILGLINSSVVAFWFKNYYKSLAMAGGYLNVNQNELSKIPIALPSGNQAKEIIKLVGTMVKMEENDRTQSMQRINELIYENYNLNAHEISIIEESIK